MRVSALAVEKPLAPTAHLELVAYLVTLIGALCRHAHISAHSQDRALGCVAERAAPEAREWLRLDLCLEA